MAVLESGKMGKILAQLPAQAPPEEANLLRNIQQYLLAWGGMPESLRLADSDRREWLRAYETTYLKRDLADLARLADLESFKKFQRLAALRDGRMLSYSELARDAGVSVETARRYLELSYQAFTLPPYHANLTSQVVKTPKLYWVDRGIKRQVAGQWSLSVEENFEGFIVSELWKWTRTVGGPERLFYYRTRSGLECDLLVETERGLIGLEIKSRQRADTADASALRQVAVAAGKRWLGGMVIHNGDRLEPLCDPDIWAVPATRLLA
jgi:predicted AAA+ superfamily ATPase